MMDPLSISASIIAVLQATNSVVSLCYDFRAALKNAPWSLTRIIEEVKDLRGILETLDRLAEPLDDPASADSKRRPVFQLLCDPDNGPLAACLRELSYLEEKITSSSWFAQTGSRRRALIQAVGWQLKDRDATLCLERIERCKSSLNLAITADEASLLLDIQDMTASLNSAVGDIGEKFTNLLVNLRSKDLDEKHRDIMRWLSQSDPSESHEAVVKAHQSGTSSWFLESKEFSAWHCVSRSFLWLSGFPGSGKTILFSNAVTYVARNPSDSSEGARVAYFYCDFRRSESQDPINMVGSLVAQLFSQFGWCPEELELAFDRSNNIAGQKRGPSLSVLQQALQAFSRNKKVILLIDALDECGSRKDALDFISSLTKKMQNVNILITSRDELDIREALHSFERLRMESHLEETNLDIRYYIDSRLQSDSKLQWLNSSVKADVVSLLNSKSAGMFRWVQCQLDAIASLRTVKAVRNALRELPRGLDETYEIILKNISEDDIEIVRRILLWLGFAVLPITLDELHEAIAIEPSLDHLDEESLLSSSQEILSLCGSLLSVSDQGHVRLAHLSVKEYLLSSQICHHSSVSRFAMVPANANYELAVNCLTYLSFKDLDSGPSRNCDEYVDRLRRHPLLKHAATGWSYYVRASNLTPKLLDLVFDFFSPGSRKIFMSWVQVLNANFNLRWDFYPRHATSLYYAASFGLTETVEALINNGADLNAPGSRFGGTALHGAVIRYHLPAMKLLLEAGADPNRADYNRVTPLHTAVAYGNLDVISMLLKFGASKEAADNIGETPYDWAVKAGQIESQNLLLGLAPAKMDDIPESSQDEVWKHSVPYFPDFYGRRSGLESSIVVKVQLGTTERVPT